MRRIIIAAVCCLLTQSCANPGYEYYISDGEGNITKVDDNPRAKTDRSPPDYPAYLPDHFAANYGPYRRAIGVTKLEDKAGSCVVTLTVRNEWKSPVKGDWLEILFLDNDGNKLGASIYRFDMILPGEENEKEALAEAPCCRIEKVYVAATPLMRYINNYYPYQDSYWEPLKEWPEWYINNCY